ncbi:hypothetical protein PRUPE_1G160700 [Prunus persica]|uniref:Uncharacterized protein n=1 Tax=Prunus persica TaxID=3760 RepID=A0A251R161_PRUPE|nr:hypothetical protein PRUPE_1G160700 [Prunus persica]
MILPTTKPRNHKRSKSQLPSPLRHVQPKKIKPQASHQNKIQSYNRTHIHRAKDHELKQSGFGLSFLF